MVFFFIRGRVNTRILCPFKLKIYFVLSVIQGSGQSGERGSRSGSSSEGIVGSVKVLTLEAEKAALERELKQSNKNLTHIQQQKKELV